MALASLTGVSKRFGDQLALSDLSLDIRPGEVLGLLGPNGAGKTTTVRLLCGLIEADCGTIEIAGHDVARSPMEARRSIGFVPDGAPLYTNLSARQHLNLVGRLHGMQDSEIQSEGERLLDALDLAGREDDPLGTFSRGMRQKAALACALLHRPALLILDEPLSGLDAPTAAVMKEVLRGWTEGGRSVLYTSHLLDIVERVCDRMAILTGGQLAGLGTLEELRELAGEDGTLEQVFGSLTQTEDPSTKARRILGR
ncbi:MAG: ABC-2 type transport system ATP-binding protein [Chlamydiales bacterium]